MARRTMADDLFALLTALPWWCTAIVGLGLVAVRQTVMLEPLPHLLVSVAAVMFVMACVAALITRFRRRRLLARTIHAEALDALSWQDFERLVGEHLRSQGYSVVETGGGGADGGIDLTVSRDRERVLVQCKHYRGRVVGVAVVRELLGVVTASGANRGIVASSGRFTRQASEFARQGAIELIDRDALARALFDAAPADDVAPQAPGPAAAAPAQVRGAAPAASRTAAVDPQPLSATPSCPRCNAPMVERIARRGARAGQPFLGCSTFPACRGTRRC